MWCVSEQSRLYLGLWPLIPTLSSAKEETRTELGFV